MNRRFVINSVLILFGWAACTGDGAAAGESCAEWALLTEEGPAPRYGHAMTYDTWRGVTVLFGGQVDGQDNGETWEWDGETWVLRSTEGPSPRQRHAMAFDEVRGVTVLFGGQVSYQANRETWEWDGTSWLQRSDTGPWPRYHAAMAYDIERGVTVLYGGAEDTWRYDDTWEWDGETWSERNVDGPSARSGHAMAYDSARELVVLFGGYTDSGYSGETWEWDGDTWSLCSTEGPGEYSGPKLAYDSSRRETMLSHGDPGPETWAWNGDTWMFLTDIGPSQRRQSAMAYDAARGETILFGGADNGVVYGDTWRLDIYFPAILQPPVNQVVFFGDPAVFVVQAQAQGSLNYQWRKEGIPLADDGRISGTTTDTLIIDPAMACDRDAYDVVVTDGNCSITSVSATLQVRASIHVNGGTGNDIWDGYCETWDGATCGPKQNIQSAIFAAIDGDTVVVADGTYIGPLNRDIDFGGLAITVRSENGPDNCIIDCTNEGRGFQFRFDEGPESVLDGFTVTDGFVDGSDNCGGGVKCYYSNPTIKNCVIVGNEAGSRGGGIYCEQSDPTIVSCTITDNWSQGSGGGIFCSLSDPSIENCTITGNATGDDGGGIYCRHSYPTITHCIITENVAGTMDDDDGGGIHWEYGRVTIENCLIGGNTAGGNGGGLCVVDPYNLSKPTNCVIAGNAARQGGGIHVSEGYPDFTVNNCIIVDNEAALGGGGSRCSGADLIIANCTIGGNTAGSYGGGISCMNGTSLELSGSILWNDTAVDGPEISLQSTSSCVASHSNIEGGWAWAYIASGCTFDWSDGNIVAPPSFLDADGPDDDPDTWEDNDYHLGADSPCIDTGDLAFAPQPGETDVDGEVRVWDGDNDGNARVDMGADEFGSYVFGNMNCDAAINAYDIDGFILAVS
ncbi:MAG: NosD domain-containing protein, partial [Planctomycetota bacterium]